MNKDYLKYNQIVASLQKEYASIQTTNESKYNKILEAKNKKKNISLNALKEINLVLASVRGTDAKLDKKFESLPPAPPSTKQTVDTDWDTATKEVHELKVIQLEIDALTQERNNYLSLNSLSSKDFNSDVLNISVIFFAALAFPFALRLLSFGNEVIFINFALGLLIFGAIAGVFAASRPGTIFQQLNPFNGDKNKVVQKSDKQKAFYGGALFAMTAAYFPSVVAFLIGGLLQNSDLNSSFLFPYTYAFPLVIVGLLPAIISGCYLSVKTFSALRKRAQNKKDMKYYQGA